MSSHEGVYSHAKYDLRMLTRQGTLVSCSHDQVPSQPLPESFFLKHNKDISLTITMCIFCDTGSMGAPVWSRLKYLSDCWMAWHELWYVHTRPTEDESLSHLWPPGFTLGARCRSKFSHFKWNIMKSTGSTGTPRGCIRQTLITWVFCYNHFLGDHTEQRNVQTLPLKIQNWTFWWHRGNIHCWGPINIFCTVQNENDCINIQDNLQSDAQILILLLH